jgi:hypothetical protein
MKLKGRQKGGRRMDISNLLQIGLLVGFEVMSLLRFGGILGMGRTDLGPTRQRICMDVDDVLFIQ